MKKDIKELIRYQNLDKQLTKLGMSAMTKDSDDKKKFKEEIKDKQKQLINLDSKAESLISDMNKDIEVVEKGLALADKYLASDLTTMTKEELDKLVAKCKKAIAGYDIMLKKLNEEQGVTMEIVNTYSKYKKDIIAIKKKVAALDSSASEVKEGKDKIVKEMEEIASGISEEMMLKYKEIKKQTGFPVITKIELSNKTCLACGSIIPEKNLEELDSKEFTICELCHRIVIKV